MYQKIEQKVVILTLTILLTILIISSSALLTVFDSSFINKQSGDIQGKEQTLYKDKEIILSNFIDYLQDKTNSLSNVFNTREKEHMKDVKDIVQTINSLFLFSLISVIAITFYLIKEKKQKLLLKSLKYSALNSFLIVILLVIATLNFQIFFNQFHELLFKPGTWLFSHTDTLIQLFSFEFFQLALTRIILTSLAFSSLILTLIIILKRVFFRNV